MALAMLYQDFMTAAHGYLERVHDAIIFELTAPQRLYQTYILVGFYLFEIWYNESVVPWIIFARNVSTIILLIGFGVVDIIWQIKYLVSIRHVLWFLFKLLVLRPIQIAFTNEIRRVMPPPIVIDTLALVVPVIMWILGIYFMIFGWSDGEVENPQPPPLNWQQQDHIRQFFEAAPVVNHLHLVHGVDGDVVPL
ncbi:hypothetical protein F4805DRAFT_388338 [Annulohypoxylon moriforme]|nr:hypothetical protein F4805DRAFT_388338 [Annulohypoxylon moriforme]